MILVLPFESQTVFVISNKLINIFSNLADQIFFVCGNITEQNNYPANVSTIDVKTYLHFASKVSPYWFSVFLWILKLAYIQTRMSFEILNHTREIDIVICFLGNYFQLPLLTAKLLGKKTIIGAAGIDNQIAAVVYKEKFLPWILTILMSISYWLSDRIVIESWLLAKHNVLLKWKRKLCYGALYFGRESLFRQELNLAMRETLIGYVGRLSPEKGIIEFIHSLPLIFQSLPTVQVLVIGTGLLDDEAEALLDRLHIRDRVRLLKWVNNSELPGYYNQMRLVVIPSKSEGLPNVLLEAVRCGTPVLAMPVGGIPDVIRENETGFLLSSLAKEEIAEKVVSILSDLTLLEKVSQNAQNVLAEQYSFEAAVNRYKEILSGIQD